MGPGNFFKRDTPDAWHATCPWTGERITISAYTVRSVQDLSGEQREQLQACGLPLPQRSEQSMSVTQQNSQEDPIREEAMAQAQEAVMSQAKKRRAAIEKKLYLLHAATGHGSVRHLIDALKRRGDSEEVIQIAKEFKRSICHEKQRVQLGPTPTPRVPGAASS